MSIHNIRGIWAVAVIATALIGTGLAGCGTTVGFGSKDTTGADVTVDDPGYKDIASGDYQGVRGAFEEREAKYHNDPYLELDLAVAYQQLGREDLAEPMDRQAMVDGQTVTPPYVTYDRDKGHTIAYIACENIAIARHSADPTDCNPAPVPPPSPPPMKNFIVFFDFNRATITPDGAKIVAAAVQEAQSAHLSHIQVTGHTDTVGSDSYNQALSVRRAEAIKQAMLADGLTGVDIGTDGKSFHDPLVPTGPGVREPQNRRAGIDLGGQ